MHKRKVASLSLACLLGVGASTPLSASAHPLMLETTTMVSVSAATRPAADDAHTRQRSGGGRNGFVRVLTAPWRALGKIFGGGKKQTGDEAQRKSRRGERTTPTAAAVAGAQSTTGASAAQGDARRRARRERDEAATAVDEAGGPVEGGGDLLAGAEGSTPVRTAAPPSPRQSAQVIRAEEGRVQPAAPGMWIPVIEGIPQDHLSQGRALLLHGYVNEAIAELSIASSVGPDLIEANNLLGLAYDKRGWHRQAAEAYERALALAPDDPQVLNNLGYSLYLNDQFDAALKRLRRAARRAPGAPAVLGNIGLVEARLGRYDEAFKNFARAGGEYDARLRIAQILEQKGRAQEAIKYYEAALRLQPGAAAVLERLAKLYDRTGRAKEAEAARRTLARPPDKQRTATGGGG